MKASTLFLAVYLASGVAGAIDHSFIVPEPEEEPAVAPPSEDSGASALSDASDVSDVSESTVVTARSGDGVERPDRLWTPSLEIGAAVSAFDALGPGLDENGVEKRVDESPRRFLGIETEENVLSFVRGHLVSISARVASADAERLRTSLAEKYGPPRISSDGQHSWVSDGLLVEVASASDSGALVRVEEPSFAVRRIREAIERPEVERIPVRRRPRSRSAELLPQAGPGGAQSNHSNARRLELIYSGTVKQSYSGPLVLSGSIGLGATTAGMLIAASAGFGIDPVMISSGLLSLTMLITGIGLHGSAQADFVTAGMPEPEKPEQVW